MVITRAKDPPYCPLGKHPVCIGRMHVPDSTNNYFMGYKFCELLRFCFLEKVIIARHHCHAALDAIPRNKLSQLSNKSWKTLINFSLFTVQCIYDA